MKNGFRISVHIPTKAAELYKAWMSTEGHTAMTGSPAQVEGIIGGAFRAWNGYIFGSTLELEPDRRIVQTWRTSEFPDEVPDSHLEILFEDSPDGTKITLTHENMPKDQMDSYRQGWEAFYFKPMKEYFRK